MTGICEKCDNLFLQTPAAKAGEGVKALQRVTDAAHKAMYGPESWSTYFQVGEGLGELKDAIAALEGGKG